jgi:RNA polymerase sigma factor (sigma-70 family)
MAHAAPASVVRQIGSLFDGGSVAGLSDRQLIDRFVARRDAAGEAAFAALVVRHGPMVLHVCRQILGDYQHAEDAFQAVFLVLARRARSVGNPDLLGHWLCGVALRTARKAKARRARQRTYERDHAMRGVRPQSAAVADQLMIAMEDTEVLYNEIDRLPNAFRLPVVLCYFEGLSLHEAARRLGCPEGTLRSRLARARDKLGRGLTRRGVVLPAAVLAAVLDSTAAYASVTSSLCEITTRAAVNFAAGQEAGPLATALARAVLKSMVARKIMLAALTILFVGAVATGAGLVWQTSTSQTPKTELQVRHAEKAEPNEAVAQANNVIAGPTSGRMFVVGRVLDPTGKPVPNAVAMFYARSKAFGRTTRLSRLNAVPIADSRADGSGRFRIDAPRISSSDHDTVGAVALAPGHGAGWVGLDPDADQPTLDITLRPERVIEGRLYDLQGQPVPDATVSVSFMSPPSPLGRGVGSFAEGIAFYWTDLNELSAWPRPAKTDALGRFTVRGIGRDLRVFLTVHHPRFALSRIDIETDGTLQSKAITLALEPARVITGRVTYEDTGKPVPNAVLFVASHRRRAGINLGSSFEADAEGRFRMNCASGDRYQVAAYPPSGEPYLWIQKRLDWPKGAVEQSLDIALPRGLLIHGKVTEQGSGQPVASAMVRFLTQAERQGIAASEKGSTILQTADDGAFAIGAVPSSGFLAVMAASDDFILHATGNHESDSSPPSGLRSYSHANILLDLKPGKTAAEVNISLRRGSTVKGHVVGPDDQPVHHAWIISSIILGANGGAWRSWIGAYHGTVRDGRFELHGVDPDAQVRVHFLDPNRKLGATTVISRKWISDPPITIVMKPCGSARARLVDRDGMPVVGRLPTRLIRMVVTPGPSENVEPETAGVLIADETLLSIYDPINYETEPVADAQGRIVLPVLIPGATYRFVDFTTARDRVGAQVRKEFTVKPGENLDLGDILIEKPPAR